MTTISFGILTVSDSCYNGEKVDVSGPSLEEEIEKGFPGSYVHKKIVPDEVEEIVTYLDTCCASGYDVILTTGGTGFSPRDVTPEATRRVIEKEAPGLSYAMISKSLALTDLAMLSRAVCGIKKKTLIVNLPGSAKGALECFGFIKNAIPHAIAVLTDNKELVKKSHKAIRREAAEKKMNELIEWKTVTTTDSDESAESFSGELVATGSKVKMDNVASRARESPYALLEVSDATDIIIKECAPSVETELIPFEIAANRILAEDIYAEEPIPPFRASMKDGYAVKCLDGRTDRVVREALAAGDKPCGDELKHGEAIRISTGAPVPFGADAVVPVEYTKIKEYSVDGKDEKIISIHVELKPGQDIRDIGSDVPKNSVVLHKYDRITPAVIGVLAMLGKEKVKVFKRKSVGILSTGNEIKQPGEKLTPGQIYDSNRFTLINLLKKYSYEPIDCGTAKDDPNSVKLALEKAFSCTDIVISSGGVSVGEYDFLKPVLIEDFDAMIHFARVNMKPGKPTTFATLNYKGKLKMFFGLPGNPVSCSVTCLLFVIPTLRYLERSKIYQFPVVQVAIPNLNNSDQRPEYHRVSVSVKSLKKNTLTAVSTGNQISSRLNSLVGANGLAIVTQTLSVGSNKQPPQIRNSATEDSHVKKPELTNVFDLGSINPPHFSFSFGTTTGSNSTGPAGLFNSSYTTAKSKCILGSTTTKSGPALPPNCTSGTPANESSSNPNRCSIPIMYPTIIFDDIL